MRVPYMTVDIFECIKWFLHSNWSHIIIIVFIIIIIIYKLAQILKLEAFNEEKKAWMEI